MKINITITNAKITRTPTRDNPEKFLRFNQNYCLLNLLILAQQNSCYTRKYLLYMGKIKVNKARGFYPVEVPRI